MTLLFYMLKMLACSGIFYGYYLLFLRNKAFHRYNRFYIIFTTIVSIVLPLIRVPVGLESTTAISSTLRAINTAGWEHEYVVTAHAAHRTGFENIYYGLYLTGLLLTLFPFIRSLRVIARYSATARPDLIGDVRFYVTNEPETPFSFFSNIFWNSAIPVDSLEGQHILRHELFHVYQKHSYDLLFMQMVKSIFWFNPFYYLLKAELQAIHEFLADEYASAGTDKYAYAEIILLKAIENKCHQVSAHFFNHQIKRRIAMITHTQMNRYGYLARLMILPIAFVIFCAFSLNLNRHNRLLPAFTPGGTDTVPIADLMKLDFSKITEMSINTDIAVLTFKDDKPITVKKSTFDEYLKLKMAEKESQEPGSKTNAKGEKIFTKLEIEASYPGGAAAWIKYLNSNFQYPKEAIKQQIEGTVIVQFIVGIDGSLSEIEAIRGPLVGGLREEAVSVIRKSGKWLPGIQNGKKVKSYKKQPITYRLKP